MGHSQADKAESRERILAQAAARIRDGGLESIAVARLMRDAGLTHGGFYGHFDSRADLLAQALERALADGRAASRAASGGDAPLVLDAFVRSYLSRKHRDRRGDGCAIAALAGDVARADDELRDVMQAHVEGFVARVAGAYDGDEARSMFTVSALVGGLLLSRLFTDTQRSDQWLRAVRNGLLEHPDDEGRKP